MDKKILRQQMRRQLEAMSIEQRRDRSRQAIERLRQLPALNAAASVFCFVSHGAEIETHDFVRELLSAGKRVAVPWLGDVNLPRGAPGDFMRAFFIERLEDMVPGRFGIPAPLRKCDQIDAVCELAVCPGLAFSASGGRLGRGAAYYDRYLSQHPNMLTVGLCFDFQIVEQVPMDPRDVPMRHLVSERRVIDCGQR
ncbi:MAG: 5-formyltetrahydrofolate cyclo-ligase [Phycisphaeraceae bacterium]|nr:5-formyltetrahydrofolate cyclo-ligase [Phycisphaeraceae bacterium]